MAAETDANRKRTRSTETKPTSTKPKRPQSNPLPVMMCPLCDNIKSELDKEIELKCLVQDRRVLKVVAEALGRPISQTERLRYSFYSIALELTPQEHVGRLIYLPPCLVDSVRAEFSATSSSRFLVRPIDFSKNPLCWPTIDVYFHSADEDENGTEEENEVSARSPDSL